MNEHSKSDVCSSVRSRHNFLKLDRKIVYSPFRRVYDENAMQSMAIRPDRYVLRSQKGTTEEFDSDAESSIRIPLENQQSINRIIMNEQTTNILKTAYSKKMDGAYWMFKNNIF
jgi:hypothetical protein